MLLLVGLGNPGPEYARSRHNAGFMAIEAIRERHGFSAEKQRFHGMVSEAALGGEKLFSLRPFTYMNRSGVSVSEAASFYKIPPGDVIAFHDEIALPFGEVRIKQGGGHAGHNGLKSIDAHLGRDYWRVRLGIGHPGDKERVTGHVLGDFTREEEMRMQEILSRLAAALPELVRKDMANVVKGFRVSSSG